VATFKWRRVYYAGRWILFPALSKSETDYLTQHLSKGGGLEDPLRSDRERSAGAADFGHDAADAIQRDPESALPVAYMARRTSRVRSLVDYDPETHLPPGRGINDPIRTVAMIVVVEAEIAPILKHLNFAVDDALCREFMDLAVARRGRYGQLDLIVLKVAESKLFKRHYSGYTQAAAIAAVAAKVVPGLDLVVNFGTAGGVPSKCSVGDVVIVKGCLFLDRLRTRSKNAFDWGLWGGAPLSTPRLAKECGLVEGTVASQIGYAISDLQYTIIRSAEVSCLDMEAAPIAQVLNQCKVNFICLKCISNGVYPGEPEKMEHEYHEHREEVSRRATRALRKVLDWIDGKTLYELSSGVGDGGDEEDDDEPPGVVGGERVKGGGRPDRVEHG
jgi:nucleoside phosphorylase